MVVDSLCILAGVIFCGSLRDPQVLNQGMDETHPVPPQGSAGPCCHISFNPDSLPVIGTARPVRQKRSPTKGLRRWTLGGLILGLVAAGVGCGPTGPVEELQPTNAGQLANQAERSSALDSPYRIVFQWSLVEPGMRVQGRGVARVEPPYRARLDLFSRGGERMTAAALVDGELRIPEGLPDFLPPPTMFWGSLGVFRPDRGMELVGGRWQRDGSAELRYRPGEESELLVLLARNRVTEMTRRSNGRALEELRVQLAEGERFPRQATFRDHVRTRELRMTLETVEHVESYPSDIWEPRR